MRTFLLATMLLIIQQVYRGAIPNPLGQMDQNWILLMGLKGLMTFFRDLCETLSWLVFSPIMKQVPAIFLIAVALLTSACKSYDPADYPELAASVDLERFMGVWYVHGYSPTFLDREAFNPTETYKMGEDGKILTTYRFRKGAFDGPEKVYRPVGTVVNRETNAEWRMRFFSVISAPYLILYRDSQYQYTLIGHPNREMAWLMSRSPTISDETYQELIKELEARDFDLTNFVRAAHEVPESR